MFDPPDPRPPLTEIGLGHQGVVKARRLDAVENLLPRLASGGGHVGWQPLRQVFRNEVEHGALALIDEPSCMYRGIGGGGDGQTSIPQAQGEDLEGYGNIEEERRPKLEARTGAVGVRPRARLCPAP
ncbi:MAG: hypothetical protein AAFZ18_21325, partial [Myxococcota bacterium]